MAAHSSTPNQLKRYQYSTLADPSREIRLIGLLPGHFEDEIRVYIIDVAPVLKRQVSPTRISREDMSARLLPNWHVDETIEGRFVFVNFDGDEWKNQWECPISDLEPSTYEMVETTHGDWEPTYEALSYTWGPVENQETILVVNEEIQGGEERTMKVRQNLKLVLRYLRNSQSTRILWVDAICINQEDIAEKSYQIRRMADIYKHAYRVVAWLGPPANSSQHALEKVAYIGSQIEFLNNGQRCPSPDATERHWADPTVRLPFSHDTWEAIWNVLDREWFKRLWIVQEFQLANSRAIFQCGPDTLSFPLFRRGILCLKTNHNTPQGLVTNLGLARQMTNPSPGCTFDVALHRGYSRRCFDPRDYVYGILGLAPPELASKILPDYSASIGKVYQDATVLHESHIHRLELLMVTFQFGRQVKAPSWVPDLSSKIPTIVPCSNQFATGCSRSHVTFEAPDPMSVMRSWSPEATIEHPYPTGDTLLDAHGLTLRMNYTGERRKDEIGLYPSADQWQALRPFFFSEPHRWPEVNDSVTEHYVSDTIEICKGHTYFQSYEGYIGLAPPDAEEGDIVCLIMGCDRPMLLRNTTGDRFIVVGECFVYGLGDATGLLGPLPEPWTVQVHKGYGGRTVCVFFNQETLEHTEDDPRLGTLEPWERVNHEPRSDDPGVGSFFRHKDTGEILNSDPRMLPDALRERGVDLRTFSLI